MLSRLYAQWTLKEPFYHASAYAEKEALKPGFEYTGELIEWDQTESNKFLYATNDQEFAVDMGFSSALEKMLQVDKIETNTDFIKVYLSKNQKVPSQSVLEAITIYLYRISGHVPMEPVENSFNNAVGEYKYAGRIEIGSQAELIETIGWKDWSRKVLFIKA
jgi:hypothetical protein